MVYVAKTLLLAAAVMPFCFTACNGQAQTAPQKEVMVGGPCEGCEAIHEYGSKVLTSTDTLPGFKQHEPKIKLTGTVFRKDGKTPAKDVILYIYHTNRQGVYQTNHEAQGWAKRHGIIRGWVKTDPNGRYAFYTFRPAAYPDRNEPAHIHLTVKEPGKRAYYLDSFVFEDDPLLTIKEKARLENRGGSGILRLTPIEAILNAQRDIILGQNIPGYE